jgi:threonine dehydrogenase-like Zn-dependent dehydrogenase
MRWAEVATGEAVLPLLIEHGLAPRAYSVESPSALKSWWFRVEVESAGHAPAGADVLLESELGDQLRPARLVVEATGSPEGLGRALGLARPRGKVVLKTTVAQSSVIDLSPVVIDELTIVGSRCGNVGRAIELLARHQVDPTPLIAARYPLAQADEALEHAAQPGVLKVLVEGPP